MRRAVLFDLFHTLVPGGDDGMRHSVNARMGAALGVDPGVYAKAFHDSWPERFVGKLGDLESTVATIASRVGGAPTPGQVNAAAAIRRQMTADLLAAVPAGTLSTLARLRAAGVPLGLVSNTTPESPERFRASPLADRLDVTAFSNEVGVAKPDAGIYLAACDALGVPPGACLYVGDGADQELAGAEALGMYAVRTTEHADSDPTWTGPTVRSVPEVLALLTAPGGHR